VNKIRKGLEYIEILLRLTRVIMPRAVCVCVCVCVLTKYSTLPNFWQYFLCRFLYFYTSELVIYRKISFAKINKILTREKLSQKRFKKSLRCYSPEPEGRNFHNRNANGLRQGNRFLSLPERQYLCDVLPFRQAFECNLAHRKLRLQLVCGYENLSFQDNLLKK
jgi:hypothetical protein